MSQYLLYVQHATCFEIDLISLLSCSLRKLTFGAWRRKIWYPAFLPMVLRGLTVPEWSALKLQNEYVLFEAKNNHSSVMTTLQQTHLLIVGGSALAPHHVYPFLVACHGCDTPYCFTSFILPIPTLFSKLPSSKEQDKNKTKRRIIWLCENPQTNVLTMWQALVSLSVHEWP